MCRGRLNVLANVLRKPMPQIFKEFQVIATGVVVVVVVFVVQLEFPLMEPC